MSKLYIFGIGGTGARVLKSLTFLLASGVKCDVDKIVPVIIDPDAANGDVGRTIESMMTYKEIRDYLNFNNETQNCFFKTPIEPLETGFQIKIQNSNKKFKDFINYNSLDLANKALVSLLFSESNLEADMEVGFKGNPNMGSVVLNQFENSDSFESFASSFQQEDRIFIISSIFGGTGAAGFPLLLKNLRKPSKDLPNTAYIKEAKIGAISILPYFGVKNDPDATVDRRTFFSKTKSALNYYLEGINKDVNTMYYIGDEVKKDYENNEGSVEQKNDSHFVELAGALAIIDFANNTQSDGNVTKEFGIANDANKITFNDLYDSTRDEIYTPLVQFYLTNLFFTNKLKKSYEARFAATLKINSDFVESGFYKKLEKFNSAFWDWLVELDRNDRGFKPFTLEENTDEIFDSVIGNRIKKSGFRSGKNYERYIHFLNKALKRDLKGQERENRFMELNYIATKNLIENK